MLADARCEINSLSVVKLYNQLNIQVSATGLTITATTKVASISTTSGWAVGRIVQTKSGNATLARLNQHRVWCFSVLFCTLFLKLNLIITTAIFIVVCKKGMCILHNFSPYFMPFTCTYIIIEREACHKDICGKIQRLS